VPFPPKAAPTQKPNDTGGGECNNGGGNDGPLKDPKGKKNPSANSNQNKESLPIGVGLKA
jgi:hypothetical protein